MGGPLLFPIDPADLDPCQRDGWACAICARDFLSGDDPGVSVGGGVIACTSCIVAYARGLADAAYRPAARPSLRRTLALALTAAAVRRGYWRPGT